MLAVKNFLSAGRNMGTSLDNESDTISIISQNLLKINVYFKSKMTKLIEETKTYQTVWTINCIGVEIYLQFLQVFGPSFMNALGGALSLFLGISFILIFELFELLLDIFMNSLNFCVNRPIGKKYHFLWKFCSSEYNYCYLYVNIFNHRIILTKLLF